MSRINIAIGISLMASSALAQAPAPSPVPPDISARVYVRDTGDYELLNALGKLGEFDPKNRVVVDYLDIPHISCKNTVFDQIKVRQLVGKQAYSFILDKSFEGSISIFTASAQLKDSERMQVTVTDTATADLTRDCSLDRKAISNLIGRMPGVKGKPIYYVTGATMSHFVRQTFTEDTSGGGISAGSWLSVGVKNYKGSGSLDSVPVVTVRGFWLDVPNKDIAEAAADIASGSVALKLFESTRELGFTGIQLNSLTAPSPVVQ